MPSSRCVSLVPSDPRHRPESYLLYFNIVVKSVRIYSQKYTSFVINTVQPSPGAHQQTEPDRVDGDPEDSSGQRCASGKN